jgi:hypothetical protein
VKKVGLEELQNADGFTQRHVGLLRPPTNDGKKFATKLIGLAFHAQKESKKNIDRNNYFGRTP